MIIGCIILCFNLNGQNMEKYKWENRILIVKTKEEQSDIYQKQIAVFKSAAALLKDRKLVLYQIVGSNYQLTDYKKGGKEESGEVSVQVAEELLNEQHAFEVILIGLDGGVKLRKTDLLTKEELCNKIDSMPMRQAELKSRNRK